MSYIGVDLDNYKIMFKVPNIHAAALLSGTRHLETTHYIFPIERQTAAEAKYRVRTLPKLLCGYEQKRIYKNMTGEEWGGTFGDLMDKLHEMLLELPMSDINIFELEREAGSEPLRADLMELQKRPTYQPVSVPVKSGPPPLPSAPRSPIPAAPASAPGDAPWLRAAPSIPSAPTPPSAPVSPIPSAPVIPSAPKAGSTTGRVWAIADEMLADLSLPAADMKAFKALVVEKCEAQGINPGTAGTQFGAWKRAKGL
jgi:hypothetical protein